MKKIVLTLGVVVALGGLSGVAVAKPINAAVVHDRNGIGCLVRSVNVTKAYQFDPGCESMLVVKRDRDRNVTSYRYHDRGQLQTGQDVPNRAVRISITGRNYGLACEGREIISPDGGYSSNFLCR